MRPSHSLAASDIQQFLVDLANTPDGWSGINYIHEKYAKKGLLIPMKVVAADQPYPLLGWRDLIRRVWTERSIRARQYLLIPALAKFVNPATPNNGVEVTRRTWIGDEENGYQGPDVTVRANVFEEALFYLLDHPRSTRLCEYSGCPAPYFFTQRNRYCSVKCAQQADRAGKREWWAAHGKEWRDERRNSKHQKGSRHGKATRTR